MKKMKNKIAKIGALVSTGCLLVAAKVATATIAVPGGDIANTKVKDESSFFTTAINFAITVVVGVAILMIIYGGFLYITAGEDATQQKKGKSYIMYSIVGLIIALLAYAIVNLVVGKIIGGTPAKPIGT